MSENVTHIIHKDRHGKVHEDRPFSVPLTSEEGESESLAMSQKAVTDIANELRDQIGGEGGGSIRDAINELQDQIDAIVGDKATVSLTASPATVFAGEEKTITLTAKVTGATAGSITIKKGITVIATATNQTTLSGSDTITPSADVSYAAEFVIKNVTKTATAKVSAVHPVYSGAGDYTQASNRNKATARTSPAGNYNVAVAQTGSRIFFLIPSAMIGNKTLAASMGPLPFPLPSVADYTIGGVAYKAYQSNEIAETGAYTIALSLT